MASGGVVALYFRTQWQTVITATSKKATTPFTVTSSDDGRAGCSSLQLQAENSGRHFIIPMAHVDTDGRRVQILTCRQCPIFPKKYFCQGSLICTRDCRVFSLNFYCFRKPMYVRCAYRSGYDADLLIQDVLLCIWNFYRNWVIKLNYYPCRKIAREALNASKIGLWVFVHFCIKTKRLQRQNVYNCIIHINFSYNHINIPSN